MSIQPSRSCLGGGRESTAFAVRSVRPARARYVDRDEAILQTARGHRVLHLGCVGHTDFSSEDRVRLYQQALHHRLSQVADVVGVDYSKDVIDEYSRLGLADNIVHGDVQQLESVAIDGPFDVIVAADIIEHVSNPGRMLDAIRSYCDRETRVIITTPNAFVAPEASRPTSFSAVGISSSGATT